MRRLLAAVLLCVPLPAIARPAAPLMAVRVLGPLPTDPDRRHGRGFVPDGGWVRLSEHLHRLTDACNVYALVDGDAALLVDFGGGRARESIGDLGVKRVERVLATHHHRDQVQGLCRLAARPFQVMAPAAEARFLEGAEAFWEADPVFLDYDCRSRTSTVTRNIPLDGKLAGGDTVRWRGHEIEVVHTPGHTEGSLSYVATIDGRRVAFTGDLVAGPGRAVSWFDLHWDYYGFTQGIDASLVSFERLRLAKPDVLLPSHGVPIESPGPAMARSAALYERLRALLTPNRLVRPDDAVRRVSPHLVFLGHNGYAILSDRGRALLYDYGYVAKASLRRLYDDFGVKRIDAIAFSHYHDDHVIRAHEPRERPTPSTEVWPAFWVFENMADLFRHPGRYRLPCLVPFPVVPDRVVRDGETVRWEEYDLEFFHMPGQTEYHQGLLAVVDGRRVLFTGDNTWKRERLDLPLNGPLVPRNGYFLDGGFLKAAEQMLERRPDLLLPAHTEEFPADRATLEGYRQWALDLREALSELVEQPDPGFGVDPRWLHFYPYSLSLGRGEERTMELRVHNHLHRDARLEVRLELPPGFSCVPPRRRVDVGARTAVAVPFAVRRTTAPDGRRRAATADVTVDGHRVGQYAEFLLP